MPIEISTRKLRKKDLVLPYTYHAPYVPIFQYGYGRMDSSTPAQGLMTSGVATCLAIVLHCPTTGRSILTHSPNYLYMNTFAPIVDWITGGQGQDLDLPAWYEGVGAKPCEVEVVVLRGYVYAMPDAARYGHDKWMQDFRGFFSMFTGWRKIRLNILDATRVLPMGAVLVDKNTAHITYLQVPPPGPAHLTVENPLLPHVYSLAQIQRDLFVGMLHGVSRISLQYDVSHYCLPIPLSDEGRQLIRSKRLGEPVASQRAVLNTFKRQEDWLDPQLDSELEENFASLTRDTLYTSAILVGPPCERCNHNGSRRCTACKGAWYCGEKHQKEDWKAHKAWCTAHRM
jgi:MYND finger